MRRKNYVLDAAPAGDEAMLVSFFAMRLLLQLSLN